MKPAVPGGREGIHQGEHSPRQEADEEGDKGGGEGESEAALPLAGLGGQAVLPRREAAVAGPGRLPGLAAWGAQLGRTTLLLLVVI